MEYWLGKALTKSVKKNDDSLLQEYEKNWFSIFKGEFDRMLLIRKLLERLDNRAIDELFSTISKGADSQDISKTGDFDFHSSGSHQRYWVVENGLRIAKTIFDNEIRHFFNI